MGEAGRDEGDGVSGEGGDCGVAEEAVTLTPVTRPAGQIVQTWTIRLAGPAFTKGQHILNPTEAGLLLAAVLTNFSWLWWIRELWFDHE